MKVFLDSDVILDVLLQRKEYKNAVRIFDYIDSGVLSGYTSPLVLANCFYIISKTRDRKVAREAIQKLRLLLKVSKLNQKITDLALASGFSDFEDALQYYSAIGAKADLIVTRNKRDYKEEKVTVMLPREVIGLVEGRLKN